MERIVRQLWFHHCYQGQTSNKTWLAVHSQFSLRPPRIRSSIYTARQADSARFVPQEVQLG